MNWFLFIVILIASFFIGAFGFPQIVGTLKYFKNFSVGSAILRILLWLIILGFGAFSVFEWLETYILPMCIGYGISFILSFNTKPDTSANIDSSTSYTPQFTDIERISNDLESQSDLQKINESIRMAQTTYDNAVRDLGDNTVQDAELLYQNKTITKEQYENFVISIENLQMIIDHMPEQIAMLKQQRAQLLNELHDKTDV